MSFFNVSRVDGTNMFDPPRDVPTTSKLHVTDGSGGRRYNQYFCPDPIRPLGKGRHGEVHLGVDVDGNPVAIKVIRRNNPNERWKLLSRRYQNSNLDPNATLEANIRREIAILKVCRHPNHVRLLEVIDDPKKDKVLIVMEYVPNGEVVFGDRDEQPTLTVAQTRRVLRDTVLGLEYLHHYGIIHRDIKPSNLMYSEQKIVKIIDFGVSHVSEVERRPRPRSLHGEVELEPDPPEYLSKLAGTPSFVSPELVWFEDFSHPDPGEQTPASISSASSHYTGEAASFSNLPLSDTLPKRKPVVTKAIDIWALGVTLYCLLFGHLPFTVHTSNVSALYRVICTRDWVPEETMGRDRIPTGGRHPTDKNSEGYIVMNLLDGMLQKDPRKRLTLHEIKRNPFLLSDISNPKKWLASTSPDPPNPNRNSFVNRLMALVSKKGFTDAY